MTKKYVICGFVALTAVCGLLTLAPDSVARVGKSAFDQIDLLVDIRHEIVSSYVEEPDENKMAESAVRAMLASLGDRYTVFLTPEELAPFDKQIRGTFSGIGAEIDVHEDRLRIVSPLEDSPAWQSGVMAGDIVLEIDGESTQGISITEAVNRLTGPQGTKVTVKVQHLSGQEQEITITRAKINVQTVRGMRRDADNHWDYTLDPAHSVGYIRITQFTRDTAQAVADVLEQLKQQNTKGLILDLRFNPGGLLDSAVKVSDYFLSDGQRIVSVKGRAVPEQVQLATDANTLTSMPIVVLANEASASAAEIVTGALADNQRAKFIGSRTFGKGSVQQVRMLENGQGALKITHAYYYLPNGRNIHRRENDEHWGVDPEDGYYVPMSPDQVRKMIEIRRNSAKAPIDVLSKAELPEVTSQWIETELSDPQLAAGLRAILGQLETGQWPEVGKSGADELVRQSMRDNLLRQRNLLNERLELVDEELAKLDEPEESQEDESQDHENLAAEDTPPPASQPTATEENIEAPEDPADEPDEESASDPHDPVMTTPVTPPAEDMSEQPVPAVPVP